METLLAECELGINAIRQINDKKGMASYSLARIADYLDCSVDYLLGRTDSPKSVNVNVIKIAGRDGSFRELHLTNDQLAALKAIIDQMPDASDDL